VNKRREGGEGGKDGGRMASLTFPFLRALRYLLAKKVMTAKRIMAEMTVRLIPRATFVFSDMAPMPDRR